MSPSPSTPAVRRARNASPVIQPGYRAGEKPPNYGQSLPAEVLTRAEVQALLAACSRRTGSGSRMRAFVAIGYRGGLRIEEILRLAPKDVDLDSGTIRILHAKGDRAGRPKNRTVGVDELCCELVAAWMVKRAELGISPRCRLMCNIAAPGRGRPVLESTMREGLKHYARRAGIEKRVHPHGLRHTNAFEMRVEGFDLLDIQHHLGHTRLDTTARYIDHLAPVERLAATSARAWSLDGGTTARRATGDLIAA